MRRRRATTHLIRSQLTDENGQPVTFATPGAPTLDERRRYALAVQRATTPTPLTPEQQAEVDAIHRRNLELFPHRYNADDYRPRPRREPFPHLLS
ncbi:hypothetical protein [Blastococcus sp. CT_GayMR16]|uniref:hypothetical protein n=1 Tax=Blastococcus sp. CT_GayMR16 TaxID=2559607 RepID=UPI00107483A6|nr:hypothetical protein [Blastococcus sp. CT_GayMR16]TFV89599.1 hypothetical protein E4P38_07515 [Blastococcus sp. CT_GayMR16]